MTDCLRLQRLGPARAAVGCCIDSVVLTTINGEKIKGAMEKSRVVPMRLFANWETDRATSSAVQRVFTTSIIRVVLYAFPPQLQTQLVITTKLLGNKRSLRSNAFAVSAADGRVDVNVDISFTVQYPHFLKRKSNCLQVLIQRRRKVKNRPIPAGFKTIAVGLIDLTQCLQQDTLREILLYAPEQLQKEHDGTQSIGRLYVSSCQSQPLEGDLGMGLGKERAEMSEEEEEDDDDVDSDHVDEPSSARNAQRVKSREKIAQRKNIKQKIAAVLKRFKVPEEEEKDGGSSVGRQPTAQELEELLNEFDELSDSGPEYADADQLSIQSNPRPGLRPYFSREVLSVIYDPGNATLLDESEEAEESSSEPEPAGVSPDDPPVPNSPFVPHSTTANSLAGKPLDKKDSSKTGRNLSVSDQLSALLTEESPSRGRVWLCDGSACLPPSLLSSLCVVDCRNETQAKSAVSLVVNKIQQFNSRSPPVTVLGVLGGDRLIACLLRSYVDSLQHKASGDWLMYIRFAILSPPSSLVGRLLSGIDTVLDELSRDVWERAMGAELTATETKELVERLDAWTAKGGCVNLPIGEVMLQMAEKGDRVEHADNSRVFVPFLAEVRVGQVDEDDTASPRVDESPQPSTPQAAGVSPPASPHSAALREIQEMQVEYWVGNSSQNENLSVGAKKGSLKSSFRALLLTRNFPSALLSLSFVKEKKKEALLQKLGMKNRVKSETEQAPVQVCNVSRLLGSATSKHAHLRVWVDGAPWSSVRFFQTSSQWATHVKFFPVSVPSTLPSLLPT